MGEIMLEVMLVVYGARLYEQEQEQEQEIIYSEKLTQFQIHSRRGDMTTPRGVQGL